MPCRDYFRLDDIKDGRKVLYYFVIHLRYFLVFPFSSFVQHIIYNFIINLYNQIMWGSSLERGYYQVNEKRLKLKVKINDDSNWITENRCQHLQHLQNLTTKNKYIHTMVVRNTWKDATRTPKKLVYILFCKTKWIQLHPWTWICVRTLHS